MDKYLVVPDIHGQKALLDRVMEYGKSQDIVDYIFLGDYIDRGPDARGVVEFLMNGVEGLNFTCLLGNHEDMFIDEWKKVRTDTAGYWHRELCIKHRSNSAQMEKMFQWFKTLKQNHRVDQNIFSHAYNNYRIPLDQQDLVTSIWKRVPTNSDYGDGVDFLTHGHTPHSYPDYDRGENRLNLDIGGMYGEETLVGVFEKNLKGPKWIQRILNTPT